MMTKCPAEAKLGDTLLSLEQALLSPLVGGEIEPWTSNVQHQAATLSVDITAFSQTVLHEQYAEIAQSAPQLSKELTKLTEADDKILEETRNFLEQLHKFGDVIDEADPQKRETKLEPHRQSIVDKGLALILSIRTQQAASNTWSTEAQFRDIGNSAD